MSDLSSDENGRGGSSDGSEASWSYDDEEKPYTIKTTVLRKVASVINAIGAGHKSDSPSTRFFRDGIISSSNIEVNVDKIGQLTFPINQSIAKKLIEISSPAHFGQGEKTVLDKNFRDTHMISSQMLAVNLKNLPELIANIKMGLGFSDNCDIKLCLHNLLVYKKGQFFDFHRDSEKMDDMIATLVISLPSEHTGGDLVIEHMSETHKFSSETNNNVDYAKYVAFYADCRHKVEKIKKGYRIVLTYNILLQSKGPINHIIFESKKNVEKLAAVVNNYFNSKSGSEPKKLVYLLDHQYTKAGINWNKLKGIDRIKVGVLDSVAEKLNLEIFLALAEVGESWYDYYIDYKCDKLNNFGGIGASLVSCKDLNNYDVAFNDKSVGADEMCWNLSNKKSFRPYKKEYDATGNEGCTVERSYRRGAVVLRPKSILKRKHAADGGSGSSKHQKK